MTEDEKRDYEAEPVENIFVSFDEENKVFYMEINEEYGFALTPNQIMEFVNKAITVINTVIQENFNSSVKSLMNAHHQHAVQKIENGDEAKALAEIENMLKINREDDGAIAA